jgi:hypothetical protein
MTDQVGVYNLCLGRLGVGQAIGSPTENSVPAKTCNRFYDQCRQEVLRAFPWGFAMRAEALALVSGQTFPGWTYVYQYPNKCLNMRAVADPRASARSQPRSLRTRPTSRRCSSSPALAEGAEDRWREPGHAHRRRERVRLLHLRRDEHRRLGCRLRRRRRRSALDGSGRAAAGEARSRDCAANRYATWFSWAAAAAMNEQRDDRVAESHRSPLGTERRMAKQLQASLTGGEISPSPLRAHGPRKVRDRRSAPAATSSCVRRAARATARASNSSTRSIPTSLACLIPFVFSTTQSYMLVFQEGSIKVYTKGAYVAEFLDAHHHEHQRRTSCPGIVESRPHAARLTRGDPITISGVVGPATMRASTGSWTVTW